MNEAAQAKYDEMTALIGSHVAYNRTDGQKFAAKVGDVRVILNRVEAHVKYRVGNRWIRTWVNADRITEH
jgi:hypothetical protein